MNVYRPADLTKFIQHDYFFEIPKSEEEVEVQSDHS